MGSCEKLVTGAKHTDHDHSPSINCLASCYVGLKRGLNAGWYIEASGWHCKHETVMNREL